MFREDGERDGGDNGESSVGRVATLPLCLFQLKAPLTVTPFLIVFPIPPRPQA